MLQMKWKAALVHLFQCQETTGSGGDRGGTAVYSVDSTNVIYCHTGGHVTTFLIPKEIQLASPVAPSKTFCGNLFIYFDEL